MVPGRVRQCFRRRFLAPQHEAAPAAPRRPPSFRPALEALEERSLLSVFGGTVGRNLPYVVQGREFDNCVAYFSSTLHSPDEFQGAVIDWGDGQSSAGAITNYEPFSTVSQFVFF